MNRGIKAPEKARKGSASPRGTRFGGSSGPLKRRISVRTLEDYRSSAEKHLMPPAPAGIGDAALSEFTAQDLDDLYERKLMSGVGVRSVRYAHQTISAAYRTPSRSA